MTWPIASSLMLFGASTGKEHEAKRAIPARARPNDLGQSTDLAMAVRVLGMFWYLSGAMVSV